MYVLILVNTHTRYFRGTVTSFLDYSNISDSLEQAQIISQTYILNIISLMCNMKYLLSS